MMNLRLRALEPEDLPYLYALENDSQLWQVSETVVPYSKMVLRSYLKQAHLPIYESRQLRLVICDQAQDTPVGLVDLYEYCPRNHRAGVGIVVFPESQRGKGIGQKALELVKTYAYEQLHLCQLYALIGTENHPSIRAFEQVGFQQSGLKKHWLRTATGYQDVYFYQLIFSQSES